jgi:hypothetical protein
MGTALRVEARRTRLRSRSGPVRLSAPFVTVRVEGNALKNHFCLVSSLSGALGDVSSRMPVFGPAAVWPRKSASAVPLLAQVGTSVACARGTPQRTRGPVSKRPVGRRPLAARLRLPFPQPHPTCIFFARRRRTRYGIGWAASSGACVACLHTHCRVPGWSASVPRQARLSPKLWVQDSACSSKLNHSPSPVPRPCRSLRLAGVHTSRPVPGTKGAVAHRSRCDTRRAILPVTWANTGTEQRGSRQL